MRRLIATLNVTVDGFCDHTVMIPDEEIHLHFTDLCNNAGGLIYGRITYQLMESYWPAVVEKPTGNKAMDDFAVAIDNVPKILFSRTLNEAGWKNVTLPKGDLRDEVLKLKAQPGKDLFAGSRSMIVSTMELGLVDELQLVVHPVIAGGGLPLFKHIGDRKVMKLIRTKTFGSGAVLLCYDFSGPAI